MNRQAFRGKARGKDGGAKNDSHSGKYCLSETQCCMQTSTKICMNTHTYAHIGINPGILTSWAEQGHIRNTEQPGD